MENLILQFFQEKNLEKKGKILDFLGPQIFRCLEFKFLGTQMP